MLTRRARIIVLSAALVTSAILVALVSAGWPLYAEVGSLKLLHPYKWGFYKSQKVWYRVEHHPDRPWQEFRIGTTPNLHDAAIYRLGILEIALCTPQE